MEQKNLKKKAMERQQGRLEEMEQVISLLEEENRLQKELIGYLQEENALLQRQMEDYLKTVHGMLDDICAQEGEEG